MFLWLWFFLLLRGKLEVVLLGTGLGRRKFSESVCKALAQDEGESISVKNPRLDTARGKTHRAPRL